MPNILFGPMKGVCGQYVVNNASTLVLNKHDNTKRQWVEHILLTKNSTPLVCLTYLDIYIPQPKSQVVLKKFGTNFQLLFYNSFEFTSISQNSEN